jgi:hypothetical protein
LIFLGTSGGTENEIEKKVGGKCSSEHMKFAIYVCRNGENCGVDGEWLLQINARSVI